MLALEGTQQEGSLVSLVQIPAWSWGPCHLGPQTPPDPGPRSPGQRGGGGEEGHRQALSPSVLAGKNDRSWGQKADVRLAMCALIRVCTRWARGLGGNTPLRPPSCPLPGHTAGQALCRAGELGGGAAVGGAPGLGLGL